MEITNTNTATTTTPMNSNDPIGDIPTISSETPPENSTTDVSTDDTQSAILPLPIFGPAMTFTGIMPFIAIARRKT